jgi:hypothetical protein
MPVRHFHLQMLYSNAKIINKVLDEGEAKPLNSAANDEGIYIHSQIFYNYACIYI